MSASWTKCTTLNALVALVAGMERDRYYRYDQIASLLGCTTERAHTIIEQLRDLTIPNLAGLGEAIIPLTVDEQGVTLHDALSFTTEHTLRLDRMQTIAAVLALRMMGVTWDDALMRTLCESVTGDAPIEHLSHIIDISPARFATQVMETLAQAILDGCCVKVIHKNKTRIIEPWAMLVEEDRHYVYGWCRLRDEARVFRLDHISQATLLPGEHMTHPLEDVSEASTAAPVGSWRGRPSAPKNLQAYPGLENAPNTARLHIADGAAFNPAEWTGARLIKSTRPGVTFELPYHDPAWIARRVVAHLGAVEVLSPREVREAVIEDAARVRSVCGLDR